jgi:hypothetical protein
VRTSKPSLPGMAMRAVGILLLSLMTSLPAHAFFIGGNQLWQHCGDTSGGVDHYAFCTGYVLAVLDSQEAYLAKEQHLFCTPAAVVSSQLVDVTKQYIENNPSQRHLPATFLVIQAYQAAFPC